jgi:poly(3-hydroxybutyrate) depolymerase
MAQRVSAGFDLMHRLAKEYEKPASSASRNVDVSAASRWRCRSRWRSTKPFCRLLRFKRFTDDPAAGRHEVAAHGAGGGAAVGPPRTLLRDTVRSLLQDHKVFITDWTDARMVPLDEGPFHLDDYVGYVQEFIRHIGPEVHVISVCQPTVPVLAAVSLLASRGEFTPRTMTMMGGPIDARKSPPR